MGLHADLTVQFLQYHHRTRQRRAVDVLAFESGDIFAFFGQPRLDRRIAFIGDATGTPHQLNRVVLAQALADPVTTVVVIKAPDGLHHFAQQRAAAIFANQRRAAVEVDRIA